MVMNQVFFYFLKHLFLHVPLKTIEIISQNCENLKYGVTIKIPGQWLFMQSAISFRLPLQGWPPWFGRTQTRDLVLTPWLHVWLHVLHAPQFSKYPSTEVYNQKHVSNPISHTGRGGRMNNIQDFRFWNTYKVWFCCTCSSQVNIFFLVMQYLNMMGFKKKNLDKFT